MPRLSGKQSNVIIPEYITEHGQVLIDVLTTYVRDLTKFTSFTGANKAGLLSNVATALGVEIVPLRLAEGLRLYIHSQRMKWAREEHKLDSDRFHDNKFNERCHLLFGLLSQEINKGKRKVGAHVAFSGGNATDDQEHLLAPQHARKKRKVDACVAFSGGNATADQMRSLAPEHARNELLVDAHVAFSGGNATADQMRSLAPEHARNELLVDACVAFSGGNATADQERLLAPQHARS